MSKIEKMLVEGHLFERPFKKIVALVCKVIRPIDYIIGMVFRNIFYRFGKVENNKIFVMTYDNSFSCNPSYIVKELLKRDPTLDIVWAKAKKTNLKLFPAGVRTVDRASVEMYREMASSKIWIDNALNCVWYWMPKKKSQVYINTWHGSMGIKRLSGNWKWRLKAKQCRWKTDYCISNSTFEDGVYASTFWKGVPILKYGHVRNDVFFDAALRQEIRQRVFEFFGLAEGTRLLLYAPTFRDDGDTSCFDLDFSRLRKAMENRFGGNWAILVRMHYKNRKNNLLGEDAGEWLINASSYPDMQELMVAADAGITDYSSWAYDYILLKRPMFLYASDLDKYKNDRGFYYPLDTTPFPIARDNEELEKEILGFIEERYQEKCEQFLQDKGCVERGDAGARTAEFILQCIQTGEKPDAQSI